MPAKKQLTPAKKPSSGQVAEKLRPRTILRPVEAEPVDPEKDNVPDDYVAPGSRVTRLQIRTMRHYRGIGLSYEEIGKHMGLSKGTVMHYTKDIVVAVDVQTAAADSPGPSRLSDVPTASITSPTPSSTTQVTLRPELKPDVLPATNGSGAVANPVSDNMPNGNSQYGSQQQINVDMHTLTMDWPSQMIVDMTAMSRYNKFPNVQAYHNDLVERSRAIDDLTRWVGPWKGDSSEFVERVKPAFIISHSVLEKAEEAKASADEQRRKELIQRSGGRPPDFVAMGKN